MKKKTLQILGMTFMFFGFVILREWFDKVMINLKNPIHAFLVSFGML